MCNKYKSVKEYCKMLQEGKQVKCEIHKGKIRKKIRDTVNFML